MANIVLDYYEPFGNRKTRSLLPRFHIPKTPVFLRNKNTVSLKISVFFNLKPERNAMLAGGSSKNARGPSAPCEAKDERQIPEAGSRAGGPRRRRRGRRAGAAVPAGRRAGGLRSTSATARLPGLSLGLAKIA